MPDILDYTRKLNSYFEGVAPVEPTTTAKYAHSVNSIFYLNGTLVMATSPISIGDAITIGTNVSETADIVSMLNSKEAKHTVLTQTMAIGNTIVTFTNIPTTGNNLIKFSNNLGINYTDINLMTSGQITLTFEEQPVELIVGCEIREV